MLVLTLVHPTPADKLAEGLARHGCTVAFGVPGGGPNLDVVGAFADHQIDFVLAHSETAAAIMATTWGWLTDHISAVVVTRGPGAASAVNGAAQATLDRQPLLLVTDTVPTATSERVPHQRIDQQAMLAPVCKASMVAGSTTTSADIEAAADVATKWPKGCVHVDYDASHNGTTLPAGAAQPPTDPTARTAVGEFIRDAMRPVVVLGVGAVEHHASIRPALEAFGAPVLTTYQGVGILPTEHPQFGGLFTNGASERPLLAQSDLIIMIGVDMVEPIPAEWRYSAPVVSLAPVATNDPYVEMAAEVVGDLAELVPDMLVGSPEWDPNAGKQHNAAVRHALAAGAPSDTLGPVALTTALAELVPQDATVTVDAGAHFLAIMPFWPTQRARQLLISNGLATMGYAVPAAIGAAFARPKDPIVALTGDGGMGMCLAELETIARYQLPITVVVFNDAALSLIEIKQQPHHGDQSAVRYTPTDFAVVAHGMGVASAVVNDVAQLTTALASHDHASPLVIDARIDPSSYPHLISVTRG